ncbi:MAG: protein kinase, partial [Planctomycetes bacterium]|nr:protein kinase [Planctomycetota bacterium]
MKRVEGLPWRTLIDDDALAAEHGMRDRLAFHLDILGRVCRAVHFAHSRGILHLDLKPDNVMVGRHGEVYLLDWGVAASFRDDAEPWIPKTSDIKAILGTPAYLSPEQAAGLGVAMGPHTDVFLLGALAHRIVTGRPPYRGDTFEDVLALA